LVPLSGGYDSRLILSMLVTGGQKEILCFTYGREDSHEMMLAEKVAQKLGVRHEKIIYNKEVFQAYFSDDWRTYESHNHHFISLPHEQDYFALNELRKKGLLTDSFIVIPGYCGDIAGGSYIRDYQIHLEEYIYEKTGYQPRHAYPCNPEDAWDSYQQWLCENRLSKFIVNGVRVFEHFGGKWMLPLWHFSFLNFFYSIRDEDRLGQKAYLEALFEIYFEPLGIDFKKPEGDTPSTSRSLKDAFKKKMPESLLNTIKQYSVKRAIADPCNLNILYEMIYDEMKESGHYTMPPKDYNINFLRAYKWMNAPQ
jgi:asparagine synthase (glutamine-hydrolysing)